MEASGCGTRVVRTEVAFADVAVAGASLSALLTAAPKAVELPVARSRCAESGATRGMKMAL